MSFTSSQEEKFAAILQPIRDLARNWDIDIAHYLEEYLDDLEKIEITFDDGSTTMNFSEAALLIQGSAGVYAKKVEYLYGLVFQVLDLVTLRKKQKGKSGEGGNENGGEEDNSPEDGQFLQLDDIEETEASYMKEVDTSTNKSMQPIPEMPACLIPLEEAQKSDNPLSNNTGEVVGNYCDFIVNVGDIMGKDSTVALEMGDRELLNMAEMHQNRLQELAEEDLSGCRGDFAPPISEDVEMDEGFPMNDVFDGGDTNVGNEGVQQAQEGGKEQTEEQRYGGGPRKSKRKRVTFARPEPKQTSDVWALLDPHDKGKALEKPLKKKIPYKIPAGLDDSTTRKRKIKVEVKKELPPIHEVVEKMFSHRPSFPKNPLKVPDFPELDEAYWREFKFREKVKKEEIKMLKMEEQMEELDLEADTAEEFRDDSPHDHFDGGDDDEIPVLQLDSEAFGSEHEHGRRMGSAETGYQTGFSDDITLSYEELVTRHVEQFLASASEYAQLTDLSRKVSEWEERIKPRLEEEERHEPFDIHKYGTLIIDQLVRGEARPFKELVRGKPQFEICRCALATLQLANVYNVELSVIPDQDGGIVDRLYVKLLSTKRHFEELEEYRAPSVKDS